MTEGQTMTDGKEDLVIMKLDRAKQALAEAKTIQQTKKIFDVAGAVETYARRQQLGCDAIAYAYAVKIEALRQLGELLKETPKNEGTRLAGRTIGGSTKELPKDPTPTLADLGIGKKTSMIAQQLADLPQALFDQVRDGTVTFTKALRDARHANGANANTVAWSLESVEQDLRKAINNLISNAPHGSQHEIAALLRRVADELEQAADPELREAVAIARDELDVHDAEPGGFRILENEAEASMHPGAAVVIASCRSTNPLWYRHLTTAQPGVTALRCRQVLARLADIEAGKLPTKRTAHTHFSVVWAIRDLPRTSPLS